MSTSENGALVSALRLRAQQWRDAAQDEADTYGEGTDDYDGMIGHAEQCDAAASALSSQSLSLSEAREEIERLRGERDHWKFGHDAFERQHGEVLEALRPFIRPLRRGDPDDYPVNVFTVTAGDMRRARSALENSKPALADAHSKNPPEAEYG